MSAESINTCLCYAAGVARSSTDVTLDVPIERRCHLIKYHRCFDREALIESLVSFIKLYVIVI